MIEGNRLKFGYGDIAVGSSGLNQTMRFQQFKPPTICGSSVSDDVEYIGEAITIDLSYKDYCEFNENLNLVSAKIITEFTFKGYIFNFENYNKESINVCKKHLESAMQWYFMCMAA